MEEAGEVGTCGVTFIENDPCINGPVVQESTCTDEFIYESNV